MWKKTTTQQSAQEWLKVCNCLLGCRACRRQDFLGQAVPVTFWRNLVFLCLGVFFLGVAVLGGNQLLSQARSSWASSSGVIGDDLEQPDL